MPNYHDPYGLEDPPEDDIRKIGSIGSWVLDQKDPADLHWRKDIDTVIGGEPWRIGMSILVTDLEKKDRSKMPMRLWNKKGWMVDAEFYGGPSGMFLWHHEHRLPNEAAARAYAEKVKDFVDRHTAPELGAKKRTGHLGLSRLEQRIPRMTEVFVIREANVTTLAQMNKIPLPVAQKINDTDRKNADVLAKLFATRYSELLRNQKADDETWVRSFEDFMELAGEKVAQFLKKNPAKKAEILQKNWRDMLQFLRSWEQESKAQDLSDRAIVTFPDGSYWVKLEGDECSLEGGAMQHCGAAEGDMYSYRTRDGKSHVTADVTQREEGLGFYQVSGKQNKIPDRKYWPAVKALKDKLGVVHMFANDAAEEELSQFIGF